jgi:hypothetical protein
MRRLVLETRVAVKWGNIFLNNVVCRDDTWSIVRCTLNTVYKKGQF